jgi:hypothetical protein
MPCVTTTLLDDIHYSTKCSTIFCFKSRSLDLNSWQIDGASSSENSYLVEGQETGDIRTGETKPNVPMEFIQSNLVNENLTILNSEYGQPDLFQSGRFMRFKIKFTF